MTNKLNKTLRIAFALSCISYLTTAQAQMPKNPATTVPLNDLSAFAAPPTNWQLASDVSADIDKNETLNISKGTGVLVNIVDTNNPGHDLYFNLQHGDIDLDMDYMMAKGSNSGIYLQGRYEIQLLDSWGTSNPKAADNGGIYERWDDSKPDGQKGYEGYAPRQNASRAPGLWQHISISFQAPRFDDKGNKIANAKMLYVWLNGVLIQENVELLGPTRGAINIKESELGPLRLQGDHGPVAFRNIRYTNFNNPHPTLSQLKFVVYKGDFVAEPDYKTLKAETQGNSDILSSNVGRLVNDFLVKYTGSIHIARAGEYSFRLSVPGGKGALKIEGTAAVPISSNNGTGKIQLQAGNLPFELFYAKTVGYAKPALGLTVAGDGIREHLLSDANVSSNDPIDPILINATENTILRSFTDLPGSIRVTHSVNVGSTAQVHYTYDMDKGVIVQVWRGRFLDATPMWHDRGDGSSRAAGSVQFLGKPVPAIEKLANADAAWAPDTVGTGYRPKGYVLDADGRPAFKYILYGSAVTDVSTIMEGGQGIHREVTVQNPGANLFMRVADGTKIENLKGGLYAIDDKAYYIRINDAAGANPVVRTVGDRQELIIPIQQKLTYSIIF